uniref:ATP synthase mitochondrial F1 complex assembly factor 2 n=1 Tax=Caenorhabditis tropicalis TaxID=1561998 RepID=A0A1I7V4P8_9PELO
MSVKLGFFVRRFVSNQASALTKPGKFYKEVTVVNELDEETGNQTHKILLDNRILKTQGGKVLKLHSYPLALAIAQEWSSQSEYLQLGQMRLTGLAFTAQDNPLEQSVDTISQKVLDYVDGDTVLFFNTENSKLHRYQMENWAPLINNLNSDLGTRVRASENILDCDVANANDKEKIDRWIRQHNFPALVGLQYATESVKSFIIAYNAIRHHIDTEVAIDAATLEQRTQAETWGNVEWSHGLEREELMTRLSAACLFIYFNSNNFTSKRI